MATDYVDWSVGLIEKTINLATVRLSKIEAIHDVRMFVSAAHCGPP